MPKYRVTLEGENVPMVFDGGKAQLFGFIATRKVRANTEKDAKDIALDMVNNDKDLLASLDKSLGVEPRIYVSSVIGLKWWHRLGGGGYSFFPMEEEEIIAD